MESISLIPKRRVDIDFLQSLGIWVVKTVVHVNLFPHLSVTGKFPPRYLEILERK